MKNIISVLATAFICISTCSYSQTINWSSFTPEHKHLFGVSAGMDYGLVYGANYGYQIKTPYVRTILGIEASVPAGNLFPVDDFKTKVGGQIRWVDFRNFQVNTRIYGVFRKHENDVNSLVNFGSEMSLIVGYFRPHWFVAGEIGFDKAIVTHFKHTEMYKRQFPGAVDGWYEPATGGNMHYGLQTGFSLRQYDIYLRAGKMVTENFNAAPAFPFYAQVGCAVRFPEMQ